MNRGKLTLGKYDWANITVDGKDILLCGTAMAFDDIIEDKVQKIMTMLATDYLEKDLPFDNINLVKDITAEIINALEKEYNIEVKYQDDEW